MSPLFKTKILVFALFVWVAVLGVYLYSEFSYPAKPGIEDGKEAVLVTSAEKPHTI